MLHLESLTLELKSQDLRKDFLGLLKQSSISSSCKPPPTYPILSLNSTNSCTKMPNQLDFSWSQSLNEGNTSYDMISALILHAPNLSLPSNRPSNNGLSSNITICKFCSLCNSWIITLVLPDLDCYLIKCDRLQLQRF